MIFGPMSVLDNLKTGAYLRKDREGIAKDLESIYEHFPILKEDKTSQEDNSAADSSKCWQLPGP